MTTALQTTQTPQPPAAQQSLKAWDLGLKTWTVSMDLPKAATPEALKAAESQLVTLTRPVGVQAFAVLMDKLFEFAEAFNIKADPAKLVPIYRETLGKLPEDLVAKAIRSVTGAWKYGNRLPTPAEMLEPVKTEWGERRVAQSQVQFALRKPPPPKPKKPMTEEQKAELDRILRPWKSRRSLTEATPTAS